MYKFYSECFMQPISRIKKILMVMKLTTLLLFFAIMQVSAMSYAQKVNLNVKNSPLSDVLDKISDQTGYNFFYSNNSLNDSKPVSLNVKDAELSDVLQQIFAGQPLEFAIQEKTVIIKEKDKSPNVGTKAEPKSELAQVLLSGKVVDEKGAPMAGVSIRFKGNQTQGVTNKDGVFAIMADKDDIVIFSFVGFKSKEMAVADLKSPVTIVLKEAINSLDDVEILAYGTTTNRLTTADVVTVSAKEIGENPVSNVLQALEGRVPGLYIQQSTGVVGGAFSTQIRGGSSISGGLPLFIIDGIQYPAGTTLPQLNGINPNFSNNQFRGGNALNYVNPDDIESVTVLKDADATAIYGSRGAYGVILITTKRAKPGQAQLNVNIYNGIAIRGVTPQLLNTDQYLMIRREAFKNDGLTPGPTDLDLNGTWPTNQYTDWRKYYLGATAQNQNADLTYSGGGNNTNYLIAGNLHNQGMIMKGTGKNINGNVRMDLNNTSKNGKFMIDFTASYNLSRNNETPIDFTSNITNAPNAPLPVLPNGALNWAVNPNPAAPLNAEFLNTNQNLLASMTIRYNFLKYFTLNAQISFNSLTNTEFQALPTSYFVPVVNVNTETTSTIETFGYRSLAIDPNIEYQDLFFKKLKLDSRIGITLRDGTQTSSTIQGGNFASDVLLNSPSSGSNPIGAFYSSSPNRYGGAFFTSAINWDNKYLLSLNARRDGSTNFGPGNRFGNFGSIAGGWIVSEEPWMKAITPVMDFFKIRGSYGTVGGDGIAPYSYLDLYHTSGTPYGGSMGLIPQSLVNPNLHWESKKTEEIGTTMTFLKGRIELDANYYRSWTSNSLVNQAEGSTTGFTSVTVNAPDAKLLTYGYEVTLQAPIIKTKNFKWTTSLNFSVPKSKLISFPGLTTANTISATNPNLILGKPVTGVKLYQFNGVDPQTGIYQFTNAKGVKSDYDVLHGIGLLNSNVDETQFVDLAPKYYGGMSNSFNYKRFNADIFLQLTRKNALNFYGQTNIINEWPGAFNYDPPVDVLNRWQKPGDVTNIPKVTTSLLNGYFAGAAFQNSTGAYSDITFLRINNVSIGYDLTSEGLKKAGFKHLNVYLRGQNLWVFSKYKDLDPENMSLQNIGPTRGFVIGFNVTL